MSTPAVVPLIPRVPELSLPAELRAGDSVRFEVQARLPAGTHLFYVLTGVVHNVARRIFIGRDAAGNNLVAVDGNGLATFAVDGAASEAWVAGRYEWVLFAVDSNGARTTLAQGSTTVVADIAGPVVIDGRTYAQKALDAIRVTLLENAGSATFSFKIGTREFVNVSYADMLEREAVWEKRVRRELGRRTNRRGPAASFGGC